MRVSEAHLTLLFVLARIASPQMDFKQVCKSEKLVLKLFKTNNLSSVTILRSELSESSLSLSAKFNSGKLSYSSTISVFNISICTHS